MTRVPRLKKVIDNLEHYYNQTSELIKENLRLTDDITNLNKKIETLSSKLRESQKIIINSIKEILDTTKVLFNIIIDNNFENKLKAMYKIKITNCSSCIQKYDNFLKKNSGQSKIGTAFKTFSEALVNLRPEDIHESFKVQLGKNGNINNEEKMKVPKERLVYNLDFKKIKTCLNGFNDTKIIQLLTGFIHELTKSSKIDNEVLNFYIGVDFLGLKNPLEKTIHKLLIRRNNTYYINKL